MNSESHYLALTEHSGWLPLSGWTQLEMSGRDRDTFLQGTCTNDVRTLTPGKGCESFVTTADGKTLGHIFVFAAEERFDIVTVPGQAETLLKHWDRYIIREDVKLRDVSHERTLILVAGPESPERLESLFSCEAPAERLDHRYCEKVRIRRVEIDPPVFWVAIEVADPQLIERQISAAGITACSAEAWEALRIELGWPLFGCDITAKNFPQEVGRDQRAISFQKGCYLGQETVARIDALGHVNWKLMGLKLPASSDFESVKEITVDSKVVARVTSVAHSPRLQSPVALAYIRRGWDQPGTQLPGDIEVVTLPMP